MSQRANKLLIAFLIISVVAGYIGYDYGRKGYELRLRNRLPEFSIENKTSEKQRLDFSLFWNVFDLLNERYIDRPLDVRKALYGSIKGLTDSLGDPYTTFLSPSQNETVNSSLEGKYEGIGAELGMGGKPTKCEEKLLVIVSPLDGSPAKAANLKPCDAILEIDGKDASGLSLTEAVAKIRGKEGTKVTLNILRSPEPKAFDVTITRAKINVPSVTVEDKGSGVIYIRIGRFGESTNSEWDQAISELGPRVKDIRGLVLDVRNNPGGYLQSAIHISSEFISSGVIVSEQFADGSKNSFYIDHKGKLFNVPTVVLINQGSASAAEILAGALRDSRGLTLIGEKSFGKGSVQDAKNFPDGSGIHVTIARWLTPKGISIHGQGLTPDIKVEVNEESGKEGGDPPLDRALEFLKKEK